MKKSGTRGRSSRASKGQRRSIVEALAMPGSADIEWPEVEGNDEDAELNAIADARVDDPVIKVTLDELVDGITEDNAHEEIDFGASVGKEQGE